MNFSFRSMNAFIRRSDSAAETCSADDPSDFDEAVLLGAF
jgi:hypothetical protein